MEHLKDASKTKKPLIRFAEEVISGWKMISDREIKGTSFGEFSIENGVGTASVCVDIDTTKNKH